MAESTHDDVRGKDDPDAAREALELRVRVKLRVLFSSAKRQAREIEERWGVSAGQLWALAEVGKQRGLRVSQLAQLLYIKNSTASNLLDRLEERGWVRRERNRVDQRVVHLFLTPAGKKLIRSCPLPPRGVVAEALRHVSVERLEVLDTSLEEIVSKLALKSPAGELTPIGDI